MLVRHPFPKERLVLLDAGRLPFADNSFDLVYAWDLLHHLSNPGDSVNEIKRVSKKYVLFFEPNRYNPAQALFALYDRAHRWVLRYSMRYMRGLIEEHGLQVIAADTGGWIFPNMTPVWLFSLLRLLPFRVPLLGVSLVLICEKRQRGQDT